MQLRYTAPLLKEKISSSIRKIDAMSGSKISRIKAATNIEDRKI
jgi:hypothetical protein